MHHHGSVAPWLSVQEDKVLKAVPSCAAPRRRSGRLEEWRHDAPDHQCRAGSQSGWARAFRCIRRIFSTRAAAAFVRAGRARNNGLARALQRCRRSARAQSGRWARRAYCLYRRYGTPQLCGAGRALPPFCGRAESGWFSARRARAAVRARHHRLSDSLSGLPAGRRGAGCCQHAADRRGLCVHART